MDAIETGRRTAASLHAAAAARGVDCWNPVAVAEAVAKARGLDVEEVARGSAVLQGGQARYDRQFGAIYHERSDDPFWRAFLIAHEIGHAELGDDAEPAPAVDCDPTRPSEAAPLGEERVVGYSRRTRREVQMDLFARELILPRERARALHLDEKLSASEITRRLGAPFETVAQQLLDALLLPTMQAAPAKRNAEPNAAQRRAADHGAGPFLLKAGPGTGKTKTLALRVRRLIERGVDPRRILILTFSNAAAAELSDRIAAVAPLAAPAAWVGTFHAFGLDLVRRFHRELGYGREPRMMDRTEAVEILEDEFPRLGLVHYRNLWDPTDDLHDILQAISRAQDELTGPEAYARLALRMRDTSPEAAERCLEVASVYARYEAIKLDRQAIDFGDLVTLPIRLLTDNPDIRKALAASYDHILVDEYQDVNRSSVELLKLLLTAHRNLWAVGDARQSIYRFRGASSFNVARFGREDFEGGVTDDLEINYRSVEEIVEAYGVFGSWMELGAEKPLQSARGPSGLRPQHRSVRDKNEEGAGIAKAIRELHDEGIAFRDQAVLCVGNDRLARIGADLERRAVPVLHLGSLFERPEIKDLLSWLLVLSDRRAMGLARLKAPEALNLSLGEAEAAIAHLIETDAAPMAWGSSPPPGFSRDGAVRLAAIAGALAGSTPEDRPWDVLARLLFDATTIAADLARDASVAAKARSVAIWQFMNFARIQPAGRGLPIARLLDRVRRLIRLSDERDLRQLPASAQHIDAVRLMTVHGSKGLEFKAVHVAGLNQQSLPRTPPRPACPPPDGMIVGSDETGGDAVRTADQEEQRCLFYVALSRAEDRLFLYSARETVTGRSRPASEFLDHVGVLDQQPQDLAHEVLPAPEDAPVDVAFGAPIELTLQQIETYDACPRRFFYTHVLRIGGRRTPTPFTQMHDVVQEALNSLTRSPTAPAEGQALARFDALWAEAEVAAHGFADDYRNIGRQLVRDYVASRAGRSGRPITPLRISVAGVTLLVTPDEMLDGGAGAARRIRTGKRPSESSRFGEAAFQLAANENGVAAVELVYLTDGAQATIGVLSPRVLANRRRSLEELVAGIREGRFPKTESAFSCPKCPAFHVCGPAPAGALEKTL